MPEPEDRLSIASNPADLDDTQASDQRADRDDLLSLTPGSAEKLEGVVARHGGRVLRYIYSRLNDRQTCEDLTQEVFMRLCQGGYDGTASPMTWIFTIARRCVIDHLRRLGRQPPGLRISEGFERQDHRVSDPSQNLSRQDEDERIRRWLLELPVEQAEAVRLRIIAGLSFAQTAEAMDCSVPTAKSRLRYGLMKLRTLLQEESKP